MPEPETSQEIDAVAAEWVARLNGESYPEEVQAQLDAWLAGDPRRLGAYAKARAVYSRLRRAKALGPQFGTDDDADEDQAAAAPSFSARPSRRHVFQVGGAVAASLAAVGVAATWSLGRSRRYGTRLGEVHIVPLADGSTVTLNTASKMAVDYTDAGRNIRLLEGEALFDVAKDATRPFVVQAGDTTVRAVGTSFTVRRLPDRPVQVLVRQGVVAISRRTAPTAEPVLVSANMRAEAVGDVAVQAVSVAPAEVGRALAWREGMLSFEDKRLDEAAAEFARYSGERIIIEDRVVAAMTITGAFAANNPIGFSKAAATALDLNASESNGQIILRRHASAR